MMIIYKETGILFVKKEKLKKEIDQIIAADYHDLAKAHACRAMVLCAEMFYRGSIERKESRGWHIREDYPKMDNKNMLKWITFVQGKNGEMVMGADPIPMAPYKYQPDDYDI